MYVCLKVLNVKSVNKIKGCMVHSIKLIFEIQNMSLMVNVTHIDTCYAHNFVKNVFTKHIYTCSYICIVLNYMQ